MFPDNMGNMPDEIPIWDGIYVHSDVLGGVDVLIANFQCGTLIKSSDGRWIRSDSGVE